MNYGSSIKHLCDEKGITMSELADKLGKSKQYMSAITNGNIRLKYDMAVKIANIFSTTPDKIFLHVESINHGQEERIEK